MSELKKGLYIIKGEVHSLIFDIVTDYKEDVVVYHVDKQLSNDIPGFQKANYTYLEDFIKRNKSVNIGFIPNQIEARNRLKEFEKSQISKESYNHFYNNCEHFANYIAFGVWESQTLEAGIVIVGNFVSQIITWLENDGDINIKKL